MIGCLTSAMHGDLLEDRKRWMAVLARAGADQLDSIASAYAGQPHLVVRSPEVGTVMVRGRIGGSGAPFNIGEATVTRCTVRLPCGTIGHAYVLGRSDRQAHLAALLDALLQTDARQSVIDGVVEPLATAQAEQMRMKRDRAAATKVDFFTMVRGDD